MNDRIRVALTVAFGIGLAAVMWLNWNETDAASSSSSTAPSVVSLVVLLGIPFLIGRLWVVLALVGPLAFLGFMQVTGHHVYADGWAPPLNVETIFGMVWLALIFVLVVAVRMAADWCWRRLRSRDRRYAG